MDSEPTNLITSQVTIIAYAMRTLQCRLIDMQHAHWYRLSRVLALAKSATLREAQAKDTPESGDVQAGAGIYRRAK